MADLAISRFVLDKQPYFFKTTWGDREFSVCVSDGRHAWFGDATKTYVAKTLVKDVMDIDEYLKLLRQALTLQDVKGERFKYELATNAERPTDRTLVWSIILAKDIDVVGRLPLRRVDNAQRVVQQILDWLLDRALVLDQENTELRAQTAMLRSQRDEAMARFDKLIDEKKAMEVELYKKFVVVLNEKKQKIRSLKEEVAKPQDSEPSGDETPMSKSRLAGDLIGSEHSRRTGATPSQRVGLSATQTCSAGATPSLSLLEADQEAAKTAVRVRRRYRPANRHDENEMNGLNRHSVGLQNDTKQTTMRRRAPVPPSRAAERIREDDNEDQEEEAEEEEEEKPLRKKPRIDAPTATRRNVTDNPSDLINDMSF